MCGGFVPRKTVDDSELFFVPGTVGSAREGADVDSFSRAEDP